MGYKLAGYDVLGGVEIDPEMMAIYRANHKPKHSYLMGVQDFYKLPREKIPDELFNLDILDGSPPCSSFSMAGSREKAWGENKKFREGQAHQVLDDLFFHFIEVAKLLQPKVVIAENVKGLVMGKAKGYVKQIAKAFDDAGYDLQLFLLNAAFMGVPQMRERTFFIAKKKKLNFNKLVLEFNEKTISAKEAFVLTEQNGKPLGAKAAYYWNKTAPGSLFSVCGADTGKLNRRLDPDRPAWTQTATPNLFHYNSARALSASETLRIQSFPDDYNFLGLKAVYVCGMSVPPFMMQRVALEIFNQWFHK